MSAKYLGAHMPTGKGLPDAIREGQRIGCTAIQVFTSSPRMWKSSPPTDEKAAAFREAVRETGITALASHDTYLVNLCHLDQEVADKSAQTLADELTRCSTYGIPLVVSHMGAATGQTTEVALKRVAEMTLKVLAETPDDVILCMENTAGQGTAINSRFDELGILFDLCHGHKRLGVCLDTCHMFASGYDIRTKETYEATVGEFDRLVGIGRLKLMHLNDSKKGLGSRVDRHTNIGDGEIGAAPFGFWVNDKRLEDVPMVVETPVENEGHERDIQTLRSLFD